MPPLSQIGQVLTVIGFTVIAFLLVFVILSYRQRGRLIDELHRKKRLESDRQAILEMVARRRPRPAIFQRISRSIAVNCAGARSAVIRFNDGVLEVTPDSPLPAAFVEALERISVSGCDFDALWNLLYDTAASCCLTSHFCPIRSGGEELLGVIAVSWQPRKGVTLDISIVSTMSNLAGAAIDNARLYEGLAFQAGHDVLTGLPNRLAFESRLQDALIEAAREHRELAVFFLDLDRFKQINDTLGHRVGDLFLKQIASRVGSAIPLDATLARIGGDEFTLVLWERPEPHWAEDTADAILAALRGPCLIDGQKLFGSASIGISRYPEDGTDPVTLQKQADSAMYRAKARGKNRYEFFSADMAVSTALALELEPVLRGAIDQRRWRLHYQPQFTMRGELAGLEALLRLEHPHAGLLYPGDFLAFAEEIGLISSIGEWVLREVCKDIRRWRDEGLAVPKLSVNISSVQLAQRSLSGTVAGILREMRIDPEMIELEIPESSIMSDLQESTVQLHRLRAIGVRIAADHFGVGPTSLTAIHRLPAYALNSLKIGRAFTDAVDAPVSTLPLVNAICVVAADLGLTTALTGIERATQFNRLVGVHHGSVQGYFFARPESAEVVARQLRHDSWRWQEAEKEMTNV